MKTFVSKKNDNVYHIYDDKIEVITKSGTKRIPLPVDPDNAFYYLSFYDAYYINNKLYAIITTRDSYDVRLEIDEDVCELTGSPIQTY